MGKINERKAGALLSYINLGIGSIIPLFYTPIMLKLLGQEEYGLYGLANSAISYLSLLNFGMGSAIVRYTAKCRAEEKHNEVKGLIGLFLLIYGCLSMVVCLLGSYLVGKADVFFAKGLSVEEISRLRVIMRIMVLSTAISLPISVFTSIISAYEQFIFAKAYGILGTVLTPILNLIILYAGHGAVGIAMANLIFQIISGLIYCTYCARRLRLVPSFKGMPIHLLKEIWIFSAFVFISSIADMLYWATDKVLIGAFIGSAAVAVYNIGGTFTSILQNMAHAISNMFTPKVMMMARDHSSAEQTSELMIRIGRLQYYIVSFVLSGYIVFGRSFIVLWAGEGYMDAYYIALLTMIPLAVPLIQSIAYSTIVAQNRHRFRAILYVVIAVINVISTYLAIPRFGIIGAAACTAAAYILGNGIIMNFYYSRKIGLDIRGFWKSIGRISKVPVLSIILGYYLVNSVFTMDSVSVFLLGVCVYSVLFWIMNWFFSMNSYEKELFSGLFSKVFHMLRRR